MVAENKYSEIIKKSTVCRVGVMDSEYPVVIPMNFGYENNKIYLHSIKDTKKIDLLKTNSNICFEMAMDSSSANNPEFCNWGVDYKSLVGVGKARILEKYEEKERALNVIMSHYTSDDNYFFNPSSIFSTNVIEIDIEKISDDDYLN